MTKINTANVAILATDGFEKSELFEPKEQLQKAGAQVTVISLQQGEIKSWDKDNWGETVGVDTTVADTDVDDYDALVIPGGQINPDLLRADEQAVALVRKFFASGKPLAAICHGPWLLAEADVLRGCKATSYHSIATDIKNAGAEWQDSEVVVDNALITSRSPDDLNAFCAKIIEEIKEGQHKRAA